MRNCCNGRNVTRLAISDKKQRKCLLAPLIKGAETWKDMRVRHEIDVLRSSYDQLLNYLNGTSKSIRAFKIHCS